MTANLVEVQVTLRLDPDEPYTLGNATLGQDVSGKPVIILRSLAGADEVKLGRFVRTLLMAAQIEADERAEEQPEDNPGTEPTGPVQAPLEDRERAAERNARLFGTDPSWYGLGWGGS